MLDKSTQRFVPKKVGPRNVVRTKQRQLSITSGPSSAPPVPQASEELNKLLGGSMTPAQLLKQSQMTETIEEDSMPSNDNSLGLETPPATQFSISHPGDRRLSASQRSPWATRMRSSIPLPLNPDMLKSILGTSITPSASQDKLSSDAPSNTASKLATVLARNAAAAPHKLPFVPLARPRKSISKETAPLITVSPASSTKVRKKTIDIDNTSKSVEALQTANEPVILQPSVITTPVATPSIRLAPAIRRSSFVKPPTFQKLVRPSRRASTATTQSAPEVRPITTTAAPEQPIREALNLVDPLPVNDTIASQESVESEKQVLAQTQTDDKAASNIPTAGNERIGRPFSESSSLDQSNDLAIISSSEDEREKLIASKPSTKAATTINKKASVAKGKSKNSASVAVKSRVRLRRRAAKKKFAEENNEEDDEVVLVAAAPLQGINTSDSEDDAVKSESMQDVITGVNRPSGIFFKPLASAARYMSARSARGESPELRETRAPFGDGVVTDTLFDKLDNVRPTSKPRRPLPVEDSESEDELSSEAESVLDEVEEHLTVKEEELYEEARAKRKRGVRKSTTHSEENPRKKGRSRNKEKKISRKTEEPEYWPDGTLKKAPTPRILQSVGSLVVERYESRPSLENPLKLTVPETLPRERSGKIIVDPEDMPKYGRGYRPFVIDNSQMMVVNPEKFTMADLCGELPIGQEDVKFNKYEEERMKRRKRREEIYKAKKRARAEGRSIEYISQLGTGQFEEQKREMEEGQKRFNEEYSKTISTVSAPQMQIVGGEIQVNADSTFVDRHRQAADELGDSRIVEEETAYSKVVNNASYSKHAIAERWDNTETEKFYVALSTWGTDFTMLAQLFPGRSRRQLRNKFKLEERRNRVKLDLALLRQLPSNLDEFVAVSGRELVSVKEVNDMIQQIDDDYKQRMVVETANREKARAADAENAMRQDVTNFGGLSTQGFSGGQRKSRSQIRRELQRNEIVLGSIDD